MTFQGRISTWGYGGLYPSYMPTCWENTSVNFGAEKLKGKFGV